MVPVFPAPAVPVPPPVVAATSSQYFERTFNRLVVPPGVQPIVPPAVRPIVPVAPQQPVFIQPAPNTVPVAPVAPTLNEPVQPNVAIAVATTHIAAPVATILLPPYPFGPPPTIGFIPPSPPINVPDDAKESTTQSTTQVKIKTTSRQPEATTPLPAGSENNFNVQALPSNQNVNFNQGYGPPPLPQFPPHQKPQKFKTSVEVVPVPLAYIAPPLLKHQPLKALKHVHTFVPLKAKVIIRPVHSPVRIRTVRRPVKLVYRRPLTDRIGLPMNVRKPVSKEVEPTTFRPSLRPATKPPRI